MSQDIRKVPTELGTSKGRSAHGHTSPEGSSTRHTSVSAASTINGVSGSGFSALRGESSVTSAPENIASPPVDGVKGKRRRRSNRKYMLQKQLRESAQPRNERYWNEYDNGSDCSQDEAFTIFVDPNASYKIPGAATLSRLLDSLSSRIRAPEKRMHHWLEFFRKTRHGEQQPLVDGERSPSTADTDNSDADISTRRIKQSPHRHYSTFPGLSQPPAVRAREALLFRSCIASFASSFILVVVATILITSGRRKDANAVDAGVIIGVGSSLVFAVMGVGSMLRREDNVGWLHRAVIILLFVCVVLSSGFLLAALRHP